MGSVLVTGSGGIVGSDGGEKCGAGSGAGVDAPPLLGPLEPVPGVDGCDVLGAVEELDGRGWLVDDGAGAGEPGRVDGEPPVAECTVSVAITASRASELRADG